MEQILFKTGDIPATHTSTLLDKKYHEIQIEAINAGILLRETDEKLDDIIDDGRMIKSYSHDIRTNALLLYRNMIQSKKILCQILFIVIVTIVIFIVIGRIFTHKNKS